MKKIGLLLGVATVAMMALPTLTTPLNLAFGPGTVLAAPGGPGGPGGPGSPGSPGNPGGRGGPPGGPPGGPYGGDGPGHGPGHGDGGKDCGPTSTSSPPPSGGASPPNEVRPYCGFVVYDLVKSYPDKDCPWRTWYVYKETYGWQHLVRTVAYELPSTGDGHYYMP